MSADGLHSQSRAVSSLRDDLLGALLAIPLEQQVRLHFFLFFPTMLTSQSSQLDLVIRLPRRSSLDLHRHCHRRALFRPSPSPPSPASCPQSVAQSALSDGHLRLKRVLRPPLPLLLHYRRPLPLDDRLWRTSSFASRPSLLRAWQAPRSLYRSDLPSDSRQKPLAASLSAAESVGVVSQGVSFIASPSVAGASSK
jgi:hypothetical protein